MNLRAKIFLILFITTTLFLVALYTTTSSDLLKGFVEIEDQQLRRNTERLLEVITSEQEALKSTVNGWAVWDENSNSTGLGLSISKGIVEAHNGQLILKTRPHTCFEIILPKT